eukprot:m.1652893 g.1652893  ORF g.1652893 m.1652893 type:complete len:79 (+) comp94892_c0_seq1:124-360(+)
MHDKMSTSAPRTTTETTVVIMKLDSTSHVIQIRIQITLNSHIQSSSSFIVLITVQCGTAVHRHERHTEVANPASHGYG